IAHLAPKFDGRDLVQDAQAVLGKLIPVECEIHSHSGRWYQCRTLPYRTTDNRIDGVVITFVDITSRKHAEDALRDREAPEGGAPQEPGQAWQQVIWKLLRNAVKSTSSGSRVDLNVRRDGDEVEIEVRDAGLGLEAARQLVQLHGGTLSYSSSPGKGKEASF